MDQHEINELCDGYADEIAELRADNERLRAALTWISHCDLAHDAKYAQVTAAKIAKDALEL